MILDLFEQANIFWFKGKDLSSHLLSDYPVDTETNDALLSIKKLGDLPASESSMQSIALYKQVVEKLNLIRGIKEKTAGGVLQLLSHILISQIWTAVLLLIMICLFVSHKFSFFMWHLEDSATLLSMAHDNIHLIWISTIIAVTAPISVYLIEPCIVVFEVDKIYKSALEMKRSADNRGEGGLLKGALHAKK